LDKTRLRSGISACASGEFLREVRHKLNELGGLSQGYFGPTGKISSQGTPLYSLQYGFYDSVKLYRYLYKDCGNVYLRNKKEIAESGIPTLNELSNIRDTMPKNWNFRNRFFELLDPENVSGWKKDKKQEKREYHRKYRDDHREELRKHRKIYMRQYRQRLTGSVEGA
jgi:hypothetical protein